MEAESQLDKSISSRLKYAIGITTVTQVECTLCVEGTVIKELRHRPRKSSIHAHSHGTCGHAHHDHAH